jgi:polysaccharide deacetylase family sporulation protein PdaB
MFVYTITKKRAVRMLLLALAVIAGIVIGIAAILTAISSGANERKLPIYAVDRADNKIALTFNCAWGNSNTDELLAILQAENIKSTFFVTGEFADKYPEDVMKIFKAGHEIQSHSDKHPHVEGANINDFILDTREAERKITAITGVTPTLYRAPYGEYDNNSIFTVNGMGYKYIQWSVDSIDWQEPDAKTIVRRVVNNTQSGSILLFHNDLANTTEALPEVISRLKERGFDFVSVSDLIYWENYTIDNAGKQIFNTADTDAQTQIHTTGTQANAAFEILLRELTIQEIMSLEYGLCPELAQRLSSVLTREQIDAVTSLSEEELQSAWSTLVQAKVTGQTGELERISEEDIDLILNNTNSDIKGGDETEAEDSSITEKPEENKSELEHNTVTSVPEETSPVTTTPEDLPVLNMKP